jgi:hypothetical protein
VHNDSCNREYDASRTRRRCATASSEASNIEKTRPQEHSGAGQPPHAIFESAETRPFMNIGNSTS